MKRITTVILLTPLLAITAYVGYLGFYAPIELQPIEYAPAEYYTLETALNTARRDNNVTPLYYNTKLERSACYKADEILTNNNWAHDNADGTKTWVWFAKAGYEYEHSGENLAMGSYSVDGMVQAWLDSPAHRANILDTDFTEHGLCQKQGKLDGKATTVTVHHLGKK